MASQLDLEEQEQLEQLKAFWNQYGNLISGVVTLALLAYVGFMGWNLYQRKQATAATAMYEALEQAATAGDVERTAHVFADMQSKYSGTTQTAQAALLAAKVELDKGQSDKAKATLTWAAASASNYREIAGLRLAGLLVDAKQYDAAGQALDAITTPAYAGLVADRRGDIAMLQNKPDVAKTDYLQAYAQLDKKLDYRQLVEAKLQSLGAAPADAAASGAQP